MSNRVIFRNESGLDLSKKSIWLLGILTSISLVGYGLIYIIGMPAVSPDGFVPKTIGSQPHSSLAFGFLQPILILVYAFAFLPVIIFFTIKKYKSNPFALVMTCSLITVSLLLEIINNLPLVAFGLFGGRSAGLSPEIQLFLAQKETLRYLSYDVAGFTLLYFAFFIYAIVFFKTHRILSNAIIGSILLFVANVPCLWFAPKLAVILMAISVFVFALIPIFLAKMCVEEFQFISK